MTRGWGQGGDSFRGATSVWGDARFLEMAVGDGCSRCFVPLKIVKMVNFMLCILYHDKNGGGEPCMLKNIKTHR